MTNLQLPPMTIRQCNGEEMLRPKSKDYGIMVSDFIDEHNGYLALTEEEFQRAKSDYNKPIC